MKGEHPLLVITLVFLHVVNGCPHVCTCNSKAKTVDCRGRGLTEVPSILYFDMQELYLQNNRIRTVHPMAFREATALKVLDLSNNSIASLADGAFQGLHNLVVLNLANNSIQDIDKRLFISLRSLSELNLSFNHITSLPGALGNDIKNLTRLSVRHNRLQKLDRTLVEPLSKLQALFIHNNPWICDCQIIGFKLWLESFLFKGGTIDDIKCQQPDELLETDLRKVPYEIFQTCPSSSYNHLLASIHHTDSTHKASRLHVQSDHAGESLPECEPKQRPRPVNLRHAIATVVITGVVCGIVCLMMLAAAVYGCAYAAIMAKYHRELKDVDQLPPTTEQGSPEEKEPLDSNIA
ncbi:leucine-rich repeat and transmembrane domain-containing protein 1 [Erpetoichthys calabaricus]|uniref:Leucine rich repeats and transmembrane domains 1 n=1 Tax=Erpetoichthys calabaricus TaxID=27687 RepID=A0A8C4XH58_ERPCA|nr:leucine-rich repeat and transmembrane domain-containing protein 1 [Erpetoichthys calabaricus]